MMSRNSKKKNIKIKNEINEITNNSIEEIKPNKDYQIEPEIINEDEINKLLKKF